MLQAKRLIGLFLVLVAVSAAQTRIRVVGNNTDPGRIGISDIDNSFAIELRACGVMIADHTIALPCDQGTTGQFLQLSDDATGQVGWVTGVGGGYSDLEDNGTPLAAHSVLNFRNGFTLTDDSGGGETIADVGVDSTLLSDATSVRINLANANTWLATQNQTVAGNLLSQFASSTNLAVQLRLRTDSTNRRIMGVDDATGVPQSEIQFLDSGYFTFAGLNSTSTVTLQSNWGSMLVSVASGDLTVGNPSDSVFLFTSISPSFRFEDSGAPEQFVIDDARLNFDNIGSGEVAIDINDGLLDTSLGGKISVIGGRAHTAAIALKAASGTDLGSVMMTAEDVAGTTGFYLDKVGQAATALAPTADDHLTRKGFSDAAYLALGTPEQTVTTVKNFSGGLRAQTLTDLVGTPGVTIDVTDGVGVADITLTAEDDIVISASGRLTLTGSEAGGFGGIDIQNDVDARGVDINAIKFLAVADPGVTAGRVEVQGLEAVCGISWTSLDSTGDEDHSSFGGCGGMNFLLDADNDEVTSTFEIYANGSTPATATLVFQVKQDGDATIVKDLLLSAGNTLSIGAADLTEVSGGIQFDGSVTGDGFLMTNAGGITLSGNGSGFGDLKTNGSDILLESGSKFVGISGSESTFSQGAVLALPSKGTDINCTTDTNSSSNGILVQTTAKELQLCLAGTAYKIDLVTPL